MKTEALTNVLWIVIPKIRQDELKKSPVTLKPHLLLQTFPHWHITEFVHFYNIEQFGSNGNTTYIPWGDGPRAHILAYLRWSGP